MRDWGAGEAGGQAMEERVGENFLTLPVFRNNLHFQDSVLKNNEFKTSTDAFLWSDFVPSLFQNKCFITDLKECLIR